MNPITSFIKRHSQISFSGIALGSALVAERELGRKSEAAMDTMTAHQPMVAD